MVHRLRRVSCLLVCMMVLVACQGGVVNVPRREVQQPTTVGARTDNVTPGLPPSNTLTPPSIETTPAPNEATGGKPDFPGIWGYNADGISNAGRPWYKGNLVMIKWSKIEPANNQFDWTSLDTAINTAVSNGLYVMPIIYTGSWAPAWLYSNGVPKYSTGFSGGSDYPFYLNANYKSFFMRMEQKVKEHLVTAYPPAVRQKIIAVQLPVGASGDPQPYKSATTGVVIGSGGDDGEGTSAYISPSDWDAFQREMFQALFDLYKDTNPRIHVLLNTGDNPSLNAWALDALPGVWVKYNRQGDRYQNNREWNDPAASSGSWSWQPVREFRNGVANRSRSEMDLTDQGWFTEAPVWNMYWSNLWGLHTGMDMHNIMENDLQNPAFADGFAFYSKYAGYKDPRDSSGVWIALRDGLDMSDTQRFPENVYGKEDRGRNRQRYLNIVKQFAADGAQQDDVAALNQTSWTALNDVGWRIYPGNYQMWLYQKDPNGTSQGQWRVGPKDQPYGRFARRFDAASGKNQMAFDIDDRFFFNQPLNGAYPVTVRVVYLDQGVGQWALRYDSITDPQKTAVMVTKTNTGRWKEITITLQDGYFGNRGPDQSDLVLANVDGENDTFHMIELTRTTGNRTGYFGDGTQAGATSAAP